MNLNFSVSLKAKSFEKDEIQKIKKYTGLSYAELTEKIESEKPIHLCQLEAVNLYSGLDALLELLGSIKSKYELQSGNQFINLEDLNSLSEKAKKATLSDIR
jgi:hypothetical protein